MFYAYTKAPYIHIESVYDNNLVKIYHVTFDHKRLVKLTVLDLYNDDKV
jgi:hypothetical protein